MPRASKVHSPLFSDLRPLERLVLQLCALAGEQVPMKELASLVTAYGWFLPGGKRLSVSDVSKACEHLRDRRLLSMYVFGGVVINEEVMDLAVQDAICEGSFSTLSKCVQLSLPRQQYGNMQADRASRDLRIAFYQGDVANVTSLSDRRSLVEHGLGVLNPFNPVIYEQLDPILQEMYLIDVTPRMIEFGRGSREAFDALIKLVDSKSELTDELIGCAIDTYICRGQHDALVPLHQRTNHRLPEIVGCHAFLQGDFKRAEAYFGEALPTSGPGENASRKRKSRTALDHLPAVFYILTLLLQNSADARYKALSLLRTMNKSGTRRYSDEFSALHYGIAFQQFPNVQHPFVSAVQEYDELDLGALWTGYAWCWTMPEALPIRSDILSSACKAYKHLGLCWLAAEFAGLAGRSTGKLSGTFTDQCVEMHQRLGTKSLIDAAKPVPHWQQVLAAIADLGRSNGTHQDRAESQANNERMIWEMKYSLRPSYVTVTPVLQKRTTKGWSKGRAVALARLYAHQHDSEFAFLTDEDRTVCRALECDSGRNFYGYSETSYYFDDVHTARALIGHPRVFLEGDRENPMEIVTMEPHLVVAKAKDGSIAMSLEPSPPERDLSGDHRDYTLIEEGPRRLAIVFYDQRHLVLHDILGDKLVAPKAAADQVTESVQSVASFIAVHSEIGACGAGTETIAADPRPHLHLMPYHAGLQLKFYVRPFGDEGPFYRPGDGMGTVVIKIGDQTKSAKRNLKAERRQQSEVFAAFPTLSTQDEIDSISFPSADDALETLLALEELVANNRIVLHWPQGKSLQLIGQAGSSQFQLTIKKDRDWFAASGELKVDKDLALDMIQLIELVEASPSRFIQLDNGRFLALTEQLRQRIDDLATFGERVNGKLRIHPIRAAALEDLDQEITVKADKHWRECVQRMRDAGEYRPKVPSTLLTELRDYQREAYQWLAQLAHWGVGACLADDMGLGKTIEALALLLLRSADGPALVIAPTSVANNWQQEIHCFAPTLNAHLFGTGDRQEMIQALGPRDVLICTYGLLHTEAELLQDRSWHTVILDEAQAIKNVITKRSQAAMGLRADFRLIMTGTPLENHLSELWNLFQFINPGLLGSREKFEQQFIAPIERDKCRESRRRLKALIQPFILRRTKSQVLQELPSRTEITLKVELSTEEAAFYEALRQRAIVKLTESKEDDRPQHLRILAELMKLRRACCHPRLVLKDCPIRSSKLELFSATLDELLDNKHKVLVFSQFVDHLTVIREALDQKGVSYQYLDGGTTARQRKERVEAFQSGIGDVFLISLKAGGLGLNLTAADYVIHMDPWWNPAVEDQASDRAHRLGQQRPVTIYRLITQGTIEQRITELHAAKRDLADSLLEGTDTASKLSAQELLRLIRD